MTQNIYRLDPACYLLSLTTIQSSLKSLRDLLGEEVVDRVGREGRTRQYETWDDTLRPEAVHGINVGQAPYVGEALQWW